MQGRNQKTKTLRDKSGNLLSILKVGGFYDITMNYGKGSSPRYFVQIKELDESGFESVKYQVQGFAGCQWLSGGFFYYNEIVQAKRIHKPKDA